LLPSRSLEGYWAIASLGKAKLNWESFVRIYSFFTEKGSQR
jgi:hypothetical protein